MPTKPILFSTEMVKAILSGRKNVTRRVIKGLDNPDEWEARNDCRIVNDSDVPCYVVRRKATDARGIYYPKYDIGDVLWVRETYSRVCFGWDFETIYKADNMNLSMVGEFKWKPSIHMKKEYARIFLKVTDVRAERLQDILCGDMRKEGCIPTTVTGGHHTQWKHDYWIPLWDSINKKRGYGWDTNPWVWVYEFEVMK